MINIEEIRVNYQRVENRIVEVAEAAGRNPQGIRLVTVTKGKQIEVVRAAIDAGATILGENYPEEGQSKILETKEQSDVQWHMIGHIQSRKANIVCAHYDMVHSLDSLKLARRLNRFSIDIDITLQVLLEFNISGEPTKFGWHAQDPDDWNRLLPEISELLKLPNLEVGGLMTIAPIVPDPHESRVYFRRLRELRDFLATQFPETSWDELSMGMSADFEAAIIEGATMVRIGSAILGPRSQYR